MGQRSISPLIVANQCLKKKEKGDSSLPPVGGRISWMKSFWKRSIVSGVCEWTALCFAPRTRGVARIWRSGEVMGIMVKPLEKVVERIVQGIQPDKIILFGSHAREGYEGKSDYDLCVIKEGVEHRRKLAQRIYKLLYGVGVPVDVIVETPERFDELKDDPFLVYNEIAKDGKVLYERSVRR